MSDLVPVEELDDVVPEDGEPRDRLLAAARSFLTTFLATLVVLVPVDQLAAGDLSWAKAALVAALLGAVRTTIAALDPRMALYGVSRPSPPSRDAEDDDPHGPDGEAVGEAPTASPDDSGDPPTIEE